MKSASPSEFASKVAQLIPVVQWIAAGGFLGLTYYMVARGCGYDNAVVLRYLFYISLYVALPGAVVLSWVRNAPISILQLIGLALPTGFAIETFTFLGMKAVGLDGYYEFTPIVWLMGALDMTVRRREVPVRFDFEGISAGMVLVLSILMATVTAVAAAQMYAETPLWKGLPIRPIFHDWMYLVSRAAEIKHRWPLEDPSLAGVPLQYHYFMLVHTAAASVVTGTEITVLFLRLITVPLGATLIVLAFALARRLARSEWAGILAVVLTFLAAEVSFSGNYLDTTYLGIFLRWLFQSPTFYFGMIFFGALVVAVTRIVQGRQHSWRDFVWIALLAGAATGAKGTMIPTLLSALSLIGVWWWLLERQIPWRLVMVGVSMLVPFVIVYYFAMAEWGTGEASFAPLSTFQLSRFWRENYGLWKNLLAEYLPERFAGNIVALAGTGVILAGTAGLRLLALPYVVMTGLRKRHAMALWLAAVAGCSYLLGILFHLNSYSQLYVLLLMRMPMAVLAAAFVIKAARYVRYALRRSHAEPLWHDVGVLTVRRRGRAIMYFCFALMCAGLLGQQLNGWIQNNRKGFDRWLDPEEYVDEKLRSLKLAMLWVRNNTPEDAVLVSNLFCESHLKPEGRVRIDNIRVGTHYYMSAFSERRVWLEGPTYAVDPAEARRRARDADAIFYKGDLPTNRFGRSWPCYIVIDALAPKSTPLKLNMKALEKVYENQRITIYHVTKPALIPR